MSVLFFTGPSGTGKSTLAASLCERHDGTHVSERVLCHELATQHGFARTRHWIEKVGAQQVGVELRDRTVEMVRNTYTGGLVAVDGAYRPDLLERIDACLPGVLQGVVVVEAPVDVRVRRVAQRLAAAGLREVSLDEARAEMTFLDGVKEAFGMESLVSQADLLLDGRNPTANMQADVEAWLATSLQPVVAG